MLRIRLARTGKKKQPSYRLVVAPRTRAVQGKFVEVLGYYHPSRDPEVLEVKKERIEYWLSEGARPTDRVASMLKGLGFNDMDQFIDGRNKKRKKKKEVEEEAPPAEAADGGGDAAPEAPAEETPAEEATSEEVAEPEAEATPVAMPHRDLKPGMVVRVHEIIKDTNAKGEERQRVQVFEGTILGFAGSGIARTMTVRKVTGGIGVEKIYPLSSPHVEKVEIVKQLRVRRSKLWFLRKGKTKRRMKEITPSK